jgi:DNA-binding transcriptional regulator YhcF (GntR family)
VSNKRGVGYFVTADAYDKVLDLKKKEFFDIKLPSLFKYMKLLHISMEELEALYYFDSD